MRAKLFGLLFILLSVSSCGDTSLDDVAASDDNLYLAGTLWPGRTIPTCFHPTEGENYGVSAADFATYSLRFQAAINRTWTQATGLRFTWSHGCSQSWTTPGTVVISFWYTGEAAAPLGYQGPTTSAGIGMGISRGDADTVAVHEMGHILGFDHEMNRPDFVDGSGQCAAEKTPGDSLGTPPDRQSIMASTGYCQNNVALSAWDVIGAQAAYGRPNYTADVTGDGRSDMLVVNSDGIYVVTSNGSAFTGGFNWTGAAFIGQKGTHFADVTGDGRADAIAVNDTGVFVRKSNGWSFPASGQSNWTGGAYYGEHGTFFADVNADGKADVIAVNSDGIYVGRSNGSSFPGANMSGWLPTFVGTVSNHFVDMNNDGRADAVALDTDRIRVALSNGTAFGAPTTWLNAAFTGENGTFFADVNGDRRADVVRVNFNDISVRLASASGGFLAASQWSYGFLRADRGILMADVNGGGRADFLMVNETGVSALLSTGSSFSTVSPSGSWCGPFYGSR